MKNQKIVIATVVSTIFLFLLDYVYYGMIMGGSDVECCMKETPDFMWLIISYVVFSVAFTVIYTKAAGTGSKMSEGVNFGIWAAVLVSVSMGFMWYSLSTTMELTDAFMEMAYGLVKYIVLGVIVAHLVTSSDGSRGKGTGSGETDPTQSGGGERGKSTGSGE